MKAVLCKAHGPPASLVLEELPSPRPQPGEVVVSVKAAGLNFFDTLIIQGRYQYKPELPFSPAAEFAGIVKEIGEGVEGTRPGDRVMGFTGWGAAREEIVVASTAIISMPQSVGFEQAAGLIVTYGTTIHALQERAQLAAGETMAVLGASGGVGQAAIELGKVFGARVIACASTAEKLEVCRALGADGTIDYSSADLKGELKRLTGGSGVDVIYDPVGGDLSEAALRAMAWNGRFLVIGFASGTIPKVPLNLVLLKGCQVIGVFWGEHVARERSRHRANMARLLELLAAGRINPQVDRVFPLSEAASALNLIERREAKGKVVLVP